MSRLSLAKQAEIAELKKNAIKYFTSKGITVIENPADNGHLTLVRNRRVEFYPTTDTYYSPAYDSYKTKIKGHGRYQAAELCIKGYI